MTNAHEPDTEPPNAEEADHDDRDGRELAERERPEHDPRLGQPEGDEGVPASLLDTDRNLPGDQPIGERGPNTSDLEGRS